MAPTAVDLRKETSISISGTNFHSSEKKIPLKIVPLSKDGDQQSQYSYEGWEHNAFPNEDVSEQPAEPGQPAAPKPAADPKSKD